MDNMYHEDNESMPVPEHVSVDNSNDSSSDPSLSPVTLDSASLSSKKNLFLEMYLSEFPCRTISEEGTRSSDEEYKEFVENKTDEILTCLRGEIFCDGVLDNEDIRAVDLWHLRELALSRGGLINANLRKQAWLKLVDSNEKILLHSSTLLAVSDSQKEEMLTCNPNFTTISDHEINLIQLDVENCVWNIEAEIKRSFSHSPGKRSEVQHTSDDDTSLVSFESASGGHPHSPVPQDAQHTFADLKQSDSSTATVKSSPVLKTGIIYIQRKTEERSLLLNIITSILRTSPDEVNMLGMQRLFYFPGMHNIVAPILITLKSPSLTSLMIKQLAQYHLKDAMAQTYEDIQATIRSMLFPLVEHFDKPLHDLLLEFGVNDPCSFALRWVLSWFASDIPDYEVICRLFDAFLVSHYTFPIYTAVAVLTFEPNRAKIEDAVRKGGAGLLGEILFNLPKSMANYRYGLDNLAGVEVIIQSAISYFQEMPPHKVLELARRCTDNQLIGSSIYAIDMPRYRPSWTFQSSTFSDWSIIQEAKVLRSLPLEIRIQRQLKRHELLHRLEDHADVTASSFVIARTLCGSDGPMFKSSLTDDCATASLSQKDIFRALLILSCLSVLFLLLVKYINHDEFGEMRQNEWNVINNVPPNSLPPHFDKLFKVIKQLEASAKAYVKEDPDLFIIFL